MGVTGILHFSSGVNDPVIIEIEDISPAVLGDMRTFVGGFFQGRGKTVGR